MKNRKVLILSFVLALVCISLHAALNSWAVHSRLNLLLHGYLFCRLEEPIKLQELTPRPMEFVSKLVYHEERYVGYLNRYGDFVSASETSANLHTNDVSTLITLVYGKWAAFVLSFASFVFWVYFVLRPIKRVAVAQK